MLITDKKNIVALIISVLVIYVLGGVGYFALTPPPLWVINTLFQVFFFVLTLKIVLNISTKMKERSFLLVVFIYIALVTALYILVLNVVYLNSQGIPFQFYSADGRLYYEKSLAISLLISSKGWLGAAGDVLGISYGISDYGFFLYNAFFLHYFGDMPVLARCFNIIYYPASCILLFKISKMLFLRKDYAVISLALFAAVPNFYIYSASNLKEILMTFIMLLVIFNGIKIIQLGKLRLFNFLALFFSAVLLLFFRPILLMVLLFSLFISFVLSESFEKKYLVKSIIWFILISVVTGVFVIAGDSILLLFELASRASENNAAAKSATSGRAIVSYPIWFYLAMFPFAPFASYISLPFKENEMLIAGAQFIKAYWMYFVLAGIINNLTNKKMWGIFSILFIYYLALAINGYTVDTRFHMLLLPIMFLIAPHGLKWNINYSRILLFIFLLVNVLLTFLWNYLRAGA